MVSEEMKKDCLRISIKTVMPRRRVMITILDMIKDIILKAFFAFIDSSLYAIFIRVPSNTLIKYIIIF